MQTIEALFPKTRVAVFRALFSVPDTEIHLREIVRRSGLTLQTVQRELENLTQAEIVSSRKDGNRQYFRANREHPLFEDLQSIVQKSLGIPEILAEALANTKGIRVAFIFGSVAKNAEKAHSDIDLMVIGEVGLRTLVAALRPASEKLSRVINPYNTTAKTWGAKLKGKDAFVANVAREKKTFVVGDAHELEELAK